MSRPRFDWFQTEAEVTLTILKRGVELSACRVAFNKDFISVYAGDELLFDGQLAGPVDETNFTVQCTPAKVEVKMPKKSFGRWPALTAEAAPPPAPSTTFFKKNWDAIEKSAVEEEEKEELDGDAAVNRMFKKIYEGASDDVRKAMIKSYSESGGTVLSTNWEEISKKKTEVKPPECMEYKKFEQ